jgi:hypothetical protein
MRRVRSLAIRAPSREAGERVRARLEDAFRTASLGIDASAHVVVRRLDLGVVDELASAQALALALERAVRGVRTEIVRWDAPGAERASAVFFADEVEALAAFAALRARGLDSSAWFWRSAVRGLAPGRAPEDDVRAALHAALEHAPPGPAVARVLEAIVLAGAAQTLAAVITPGEAGSIAAACGWPTPERPEACPAEIASCPAPWRGAIAALAAVLPRADARVALLGLAAVARSRPALAATPLHAPTAARWTEEAATTPRRAAAGAPDAPAGVERRRALEIDEAPVPTGAASRPGGEGGDADLTTATELGGLFFLVAVLARLGLPQFLAEHPAAADTPWRIFLAIAAQLGAERDPLALALAEELDPEQPALSGFALPSTTVEALAHEPVRALDGRSTRDANGWLVRLAPRGSSRAAPRHDSPRVGDDPALDRALLADAWCVAIERWLAAYAPPELDVASLVRRPALFRATATHWDVVFALADADLRVRRLGLDSDPGWTPWLGKVIAFHFEVRS